MILWKDLLTHQLQNKLKVLGQQTVETSSTYYYASLQNTFIVCSHSSTPEIVNFTFLGGILYKRGRKVYFELEENYFT